MHMLKKDDKVKVIISASEINFNKKVDFNSIDDDCKYRIDISFYIEKQKEAFIDVSYTISSDTANNISLEEELKMNIKNQMNELEIEKYSIIESEVDTADGYGRQIIKIDKIKG